MARRWLAAALALCLLFNGFCYPHLRLKKRQIETDEQNTISETNAETIITAEQQNSPSTEKAEVNYELPPPIPYNDDDDDDDDGFEPMNTSSSGDGGGSNIFSLLRIAGAILPSSSNYKIFLQNTIKQLLKLNQHPRRQFIEDNEIEIDYISDLKPPPFQKQEDGSDESGSDSRSDSNESEDTAAEESIEENGKNSKEDSRSDDASVDDDSDYDSDEPPGGGDGQGGGILGLLAGLSGGEDGQSDLGSLLATISGIVANLSGDGIDLNALIASGIGLFVGLLSEGEENPGAVIASYLLTSLDTITGGGSKNNGAFFGTFLSKLVKGTSAVGDSEENSEENGNKVKMSDSAGFFVQDSADAPSPLWTLKLDILRAVVQFATSVLGMASSSSFAASSG